MTLDFNDKVLVLVECSKCDSSTDFAAFKGSDTTAKIKCRTCGWLFVSGLRLKLWSLDDLAFVIDEQRGESPSGKPGLAAGSQAPGNET